MRRKSRLQEQLATKGQKVYKDTFQQEGERRLNEIVQKLATKKNLILYGGLAIVLVAIVLLVLHVREKRIDSAAQLALTKAIETSEAIISENPVPAGFDQKVFKNEKERAEAAIAEFQKIVSTYGSPYRDKALYFIAVNKLYIDREAAISELQSLSARKDEVGILSKYALAQAKVVDGKYDEAVSIYQELLSLSDPILSKDTLNFNLAEVYEKQGKTAEAAEIYYRIAKAASEAKDAQGSPLPRTQIAKEAEEKLQALDPERAKEIRQISFTPF
ncbi:MAG: tetratricopeptide repeat protein [Pyrinomonadaceae bacterium]|nr:tetratricopeptide repeat protein [Pyrinomonadaceae bacterium]MCX7640516.1 tetratricopeptide repeat protein [Pyrinomonadaceae bacterium]MDW8303903.1 tetratricopeptide repeat protein [Acidobacteriota bacterium]